MSEVLDKKYNFRDLNISDAEGQTANLDELAEKEPAGCIERCEKLLASAVEKGNKELEAICLKCMGAAYHNLTDFRKSLACVNNALDIFNGLNDKKGIASSLNNKGRVFIEIGKYEDALENHLASLRILEELHDKKGISKSYNNIGLIYWYCENYEKALEYHMKSLEIKKELDDKRGIARTLNNLGNVYKHLEQPAKAVESYNKALEINSELNNSKGTAFCLNNLGTVHKDLGNIELALEYYNESLKLKQELGDKQGIANSYMNLGTASFEKEDIAKAREYYDKGLKLAAEEDIKHIQKGFCYNYMELYAKTGDYKKALEYFKKYLELKDTLFNEEVARKFTELQLRYDIEKTEKENELLRQRNEIQKLELERQKNLKELNATKDKFFSIIAHDLKSPFAVMTSFLNILKKTENYDKDSVMQLVNEMDKTVKASINLLENLLEWSRTQTGRIKFEPKNLNLKPVLAEVLSLLGGNAASKNITLVNRIDSSHAVYADKDMLNTIFRNLVSNAVKFSFQGGEIVISSAYKNSGIEVSVKDSGTGIEPELTDKIFTIDTKTRTLGTAGEKGTGIGLILCKEFVERNGGKIWVESVLGKGSAFYFTLPKSA